MVFVSGGNSHARCKAHAHGSICRPRVEGDAKPPSILNRFPLLHWVRYMICLYLPLPLPPPTLSQPDSLRAP